MSSFGGASVAQPTKYFICERQKGGEGAAGPCFVGEA